MQPNLPKQVPRSLAANRLDGEPQYKYWPFDKQTHTITASRFPYRNRQAIVSALMRAPMVHGQTANSRARKLPEFLDSKPDEG